jgi:Ran GTPase-activating protein (RanGAP) involved in mRNA processing and transport
MKVDKLKYLLIAIYYAATVLCAEIQGAEEQRDELTTCNNSRYAEFLEEYNSIREDHQCLLRKMPQLHNASMGIDDEAAKIIALGIKYNTSLNYVDLNHNNITSEGIRYLAHALSGKPITQFHMHGSKIGNEGHKELAKAIRTWSDINTLNLNCTDLGDEGAEALADAVKDKIKLTTFYCGTGHNMTSEGAKKLFSILANRSY